MYVLRFDGHIPSKSNSYRFVSRGKKAYWIKTDDCLLFEDKAAKVIQAQREAEGWPDLCFPAQETVAVTLIWHRGGMRPRDLDNIKKIVFDCLQAGKLFANDAQITWIHARMLFDAPTEADEWLDVIVEQGPIPDERWIKHHAKRMQAAERKALRQLNEDLTKVGPGDSPPRKSAEPTRSMLPPGKKPPSKSAAAPDGSASSTAKPARSTSDRGTSGKRSGTTRPAASGCADPAPTTGPVPTSAD